MSALSIQVPFPVFQGRDGQPLENGYVWIGAPNLNPQTNPVVAYYDAALTIVAPQPLRTLNGYVSRAGTPAQIYVDGVNFSILVQDSKGSMVYNFPDGSGISPNAAGVEYDPPFAGALTTGYTVEDKLSQTVSVKDFGAVGDGVTDDTVAIQAAVNAVGAIGGGSVYFPAGTYKISNEITVNSIGVVLIGASRWATLIRQHTPNLGIFKIMSMFCGVKALSFMYAGTPASGATAIYVEGSYVTLEDFVIRSSHTGIHYKNGVAGRVIDFEILDYESAGLIAESLNDLFVSRFILNAGNETRGTLGGLRLVNKVEAFICTDGDILLGSFSMTMDAVTYALGLRPAYNNFTNVFFDSAVNPTQINKCVETEFVGCWFSGGRSGAGKSGADISQSQSIRFTNTRFFNCGAQGAVVQASSTDVTFTACSFESNSVTAGAGVAHGLQISNNTTQFQVIGCKASNGLFTGTQGYGIFIGSDCNQFVVRDCNLIGNATGPLLDGTADTSDKTIHGNIGYRTSNTGEGVIAAGTTFVVVSHGLAAPPRLQDIVLTRQNTNAGSTDLFVSGITATQFQINTAASPSINVTMTWHARIKGA